MTIDSPARQNRRLRRHTGLIVVGGLALLTGLYAFVAYALLPPGALVHPDMAAVFADERFAIYSHVFASATALVIGPVQFLPGLRRRRGLHRGLGRVYLAMVAVGGLSGFHLGFVASGGPVARAGYVTLAVAWLGCGAQALWSIRLGQVEAHRDWMIRTYALTFAGATLRLQVAVVSFGLGIPFLDFYPWVAWTCWVPNLLVAEWLIARRRRPSPPAPRPGVADVRRTAR